MVLEYTRKTPALAGTEILWQKVFFLTTVHVIAIRGLSMLQDSRAETLIFGLVTFVVSGLGVTAGAHRLWAHRSYKAKLPLRIFLAMMNSAAWQVSILRWCRDHRTHHKFSETNADPHNALRGFFFSHIGCHMVKKHPEVTTKGRQIDLDDLYNDPVVVIQNRFFFPSALFMCILLPTWIPYYFWEENLWCSFYITVLRYCISLNVAFSVNSFAHLVGNKPYDARINPRENSIVAFFSMGEGFHNFHHVFPQDYATSEFGLKLNPTTAFIDIMAFMGQAYDRKKVSPQLIEARKKRSGELIFQTK